MQIKFRLVCYNTFACFTQRIIKYYANRVKNVTGNKVIRSNQVSVAPNIVHWALARTGKTFGLLYGLTARYNKS